MPWKPRFKGEYPTLGHDVLRWMIENLAAPDRAEYEPYVPTREQAEFLLQLYRLDSRTGRRLVRRAVLSRPRGWGKSPFLAAIALADALADVVPAGWDASGRPVGRPWSSIRTPLVYFAAVSEQQTQNAWRPALEMVDGPLVENYPGVEPLNTMIVLPRGEIRPITSSATTSKGAKGVCAVLDQTEMWYQTNGGHRLAEVLRSNAAKLNGVTIESPNAFVPGEESVAEQSAMTWKQMKEGRTRETGLLYSHREAPPETELDDRTSLRSGLHYAYGDSADEKTCVIHTPPCKRRGWVDLDRLVAEVWDPQTPPQVARADFLNQITHASNSWLSSIEWNACTDVRKVVSDGEMVTLGFDGSRRRKKGIADATALVGTRVEDGHVFEIAVWEQPLGPAGKDWEVRIPDVKNTVARAFDRYNVVGFYADPARWESTVADWEAEYGHQLEVKATREHPIEWWTAGRQAIMTRALEQFENAVIERELTHDGSYTLSRHVINARRITKQTGYLIAKDYPDSPNKIDAAMAAVLSYAAFVDVLAKGVLVDNDRAGYVPRRIL